MHLNLKDEDAYNKSVDGVTAYRKAIEAYISCQAQEANDKIQADVKAAEQKFK